MQVTTRTSVQDDGSVRHQIGFDRDPDDEAVAAFDDYDCDEIVITQQPDNPERITCLCYDGDTVIWQGVFETRELSFDPISLLGRGESERLLGVEASEDSPPEMVASHAGVGTVTEQAQVGNPPAQIRTTLQSLGMTVVPQGQWWLDV